MAEVSRTLKNLGIALAGAGVGYVAALLSAPASGRNLRRRIGRRLEDETNELARKAEHTLRDAKHKVTQALRG